MKLGKFILGFILVGFFLWLLLLSSFERANWDHIKALEMISPGMSREEVVTRLGKPSYSLSPSLIAGGETLVYGCWRRTQTDISVLLNKEGRVATVFYSDFHYPPIGGIEIE